jgi:iron-sulfur cluster assembly accessory protein|tara:strand:+ start:826 stop:1164 length:339 start_codon:yes stop_codon:yes gene_type:complete
MKWFDITDEAKHQMTKMMEKHPSNYAISLAVKGGGCAGFKYDWGFIKNKEDISKDDEVVEWEGPTRFVVDETSMMYVAGTKIDWKEELFGSQFTIENPNAQSGCGCGESFGV